MGSALTSSTAEHAVVCTLRRTACRWRSAKVVVVTTLAALDPTQHSAPRGVLVPINPGHCFPGGSLRRPISWFGRKGVGLRDRLPTREGADG